MGKVKQCHTVEKCDEWLSTRTRKKVVTTPSSIKRASLSRPLKNISNILLTQNSPPPKQLKTHTKQSTLSNFFNGKVTDIKKFNTDLEESSEELPVLTYLTNTTRCNNGDNGLSPSIEQHSVDDTGDHYYMEENLPALSRKYSPGCRRNQKHMKTGTKNSVIDQTKENIYDLSVQDTGFDHYSSSENSCVIEPYNIIEKRSRNRNQSGELCSINGDEMDVETSNKTNSYRSIVHSSQQERKFKGGTKLDQELAQKAMDAKLGDTWETQIQDFKKSISNSVSFEESPSQFIVECDSKSHFDNRENSKFDKQNNEKSDKFKSRLGNFSSDTLDFSCESKLGLEEIPAVRLLDLEQLESNLSETQTSHLNLNSKHYLKSDIVFLESSKIPCTKISEPIDAFSNSLSLSPDTGENKHSLCTNSLEMNSDLYFGSEESGLQKPLISTQEANKELEDFSLDSQSDF